MLMLFFVYVLSFVISCNLDRCEQHQRLTTKNQLFLKGHTRKNILQFYINNTSKKTIIALRHYWCSDYLHYSLNVMWTVSPLTPLRMGHFGAAHGCGRQTSPPPFLKSIIHTMMMMKLKLYIT